VAKKIGADTECDRGSTRGRRGAHAAGWGSFGPPFGASVLRSARLVAPLLLAGLLGLLGGCDAPPASPPDVVLVVVDALRADHLTHLGYERATSVALDPLREESVLFAETWAAAPWTLPSVASLLTGRLPPAHGLTRRRDALSADVPTLAARLRERGYATAAVVHHPEISRERGFARGFDRFEGVADADAGAFLPWLREWLAGPPPEPFFLYLHAGDARGPYRVPASARAALLGRPPSKTFGWAEARARGLLTRRGRVAPEEVRAVVEQYDTALRHALDRVGEVFEMLRRQGRWDDTLVVLTGDHGEELFDRGRLGHGLTLHREVLRVPLYVKPPGGAPHPRVVRAPVSAVDVVPTILDLLGIPLPPPDDARAPARSLAPVVRGEHDPPPVPIFHHSDYVPGRPARAVRDGRWLLVERTTPDGVDRELYDVAIDPAEREDRIAQGSEIAHRLAARLETTFGTAPAPPTDE